jgi:hypothetical protein
MTSVQEFSRMDREARLLALKYAADTYGIESPEYCKLARMHQHILSAETETRQHNRWAPRAW